jgi:predicted TIM-barrel fold metal-dependent hydrolase
MKINIVTRAALMMLIAGIVSCGSQDKYYSVSDFGKVKKIDAHFHYLTADERYMRFAISLNFKLLTPIWDGEVPIKDQLMVSTQIRRSFPDDYAFFTTFPADSFYTAGFADRTIARIEESIRSGATGVKIWKNIGMVLKDQSGRFVMVDNPVFEPVFRFLETNHIPVIGHLGEPKDCWLPFEKMTDPSDVSYYKNNPQYHMFMHPEVPSYEQQIRARDNLLRKHPGLDFTGAHLASLEWNVDEIAKRLDSFPNLRVDLAARMYHIQYQSKLDRKHVRDFMIKYQDRIIYGTDNEVHDIDNEDSSKILDNLGKGWLSQWIYLATDSVMGVKGLKLPKEVIDKIYYKNSIRYFRPYMK